MGKTFLSPEEDVIKADWGVVPALVAAFVARRVGFAFPCMCSSGVLSHSPQAWAAQGTRKSYLNDKGNSLNPT